ncbi:MAG: response regulator [Verrucomicrobiia bacterium]
MQTINRNDAPWTGVVPAPPDERSVKRLESSVQGELGVGRTPQVYLPAASATRTASAAPAVEPEPAQGSEETILVVEDETGLLELVRHVLQGCHYRILAASSGVEALQVWEEHRGRVDLLLTDMIMPGGMTGNDLAAKLRKQKPGLKVIYTSGYSSELMGKDAGASDTTFLAKPYLLPELLQTVRQSFDASPEGKHERAFVPVDAVPAPAPALSTRPA